MLKNAIKGFLTLALLFTSTLNALEYGLFAKKDGIIPIKKFAIVGERCSGTNYITNLVLLNLDIGLQNLSQKHFPPWFKLPAEKYPGQPQSYTFADTDEFLFIVIFRNPYDWVRSLHRQPWHASKKLVRIPFAEFIRKPWEVDRRVIQDPLVDCNLNGTPFSNVLKLRTAKIKNMLLIKNRAKNVYYVNYEIVRDYPKKVLAELKDIFQLTAKPVYQAVTQYKGISSRDYKPKHYKPISKKDLYYINRQLNKKLERSIGYDLKY